MNTNEEYLKQQEFVGAEVSQKHQALLGRNFNSSFISHVAKESVIHFDITTGAINQS